LGFEGELPGQDSNLDKESQNLLVSDHKVLQDSTCDETSRRRPSACTTLAETDPDFSRLANAWPGLSAAVRSAILTLVDATSNATPATDKPRGKKSRNKT
jgi:hypothetical protein